MVLISRARWAFSGFCSWLEVFSSPADSLVGAWVSFSEPEQLKYILHHEDHEGHEGGMQNENCKMQKSKWLTPFAVCFCSICIFQFALCNLHSRISSRLCPPSW